MGVTIPTAFPSRPSPAGSLDGGNVIWHEDMTVQGNIAAIKRLVIQNDRNFPNETDPSAYKVYPNALNASYSCSTKCSLKHP
ncbi:hypothetical protein CEP51_003272 [Fusarium floridanum]|uniref:Uncharacterized protein n=1 Tax=Fusarium floridanum TaxID=1325733 RepID=A0A428S6V8_9HYPO|nr:hypothetical protein CEP51_003272 [Fusarium floridanum]